MRARPAARHGVAAAVALVLLSGCAGRGAVVIPVTEPAPADQARCARLHAGLPAAVGGEKRRETKPQSVLTAAWGDPPIRLSCGVSRPAGLAGGQTAPVGINGVAWLQRAGTGGGSPAVFTVVDRGVFVQVDVPQRYAGRSGILLDLSDAIARVLPRRTIPR